MKALKIIAMPVDNGGCGNLRVRQPLALLKKYTEHDTHVIDTKDDDMTEVAKALSVADIAIVRQGGELGMTAIRSKPEYAHLKWVLDIDDNIELISPYSEHYKEYGTHEFFDENSGKYIWKDGVGGFSVIHNRNRVISLMVGLREADMVTVTTEKLASYARKYNPNVVVLPNAVDTSKWGKLPFKKNKQLRVGWSGGVSHYEDWYSIKLPLNQLMRKYQFKLVMVGSGYEGIIDEDNRKNLEILPWVGFEAHSYHMMTLNLDMGIIPLADLPFNNYKSSIKFYEFCALGIPSVVADVCPYSKDVENGKNCVSYITGEEFYNNFEMLLTNEKLRLKLGEQALSWVRAKHDASRLVPVWKRAYESLTTQGNGDTVDKD